VTQTSETLMRRAVACLESKAPDKPLPGEVLAVRAFGPRPPLRALLRQPGMVAGLAMAFGLFWGTGGLISLFPDRFDSMNAAPSAIGGTVAAAWGALALSRRWEPEPGWVDRVGRVLGCAAIGTELLGLVVFRI
jgi:hypothetical protein